MFKIELLPAANGDAVWIEYGDPKKPRRIVIDGGPAPAYEQGLRRRILELDKDERRIDLFIITHIDCDHIDGSLILLQEATELNVRFGEVWFNGWKQLEAFAPANFQPIQGEFLTALLEGAGMQERWNARVDGRALVVPDDGPLPTWPLDDNAQLTLLSPGVRQLRRLRARWRSAIRDFNPGDSAQALERLKARREYRPPTFPPVFGVSAAGDDRSVANGSSIAFVLEHDGASCLFAADAHPRVLTASLARFAQRNAPGRTGPVAFDAVKVPHHGSFRNISDELVTAMVSRRWLISTNGAISGHPDRETAALIAQHAVERPDFLCNYKSPSTIAFAVGNDGKWSTTYPGEGIDRGPAGGIEIHLTTQPARPPKPRPSSPARVPAKRPRSGRRRRHSRRG